MMRTSVNRLTRLANGALLLGATALAGCALFSDDLSNVEAFGAREVEGSLGEHLAIRFDPGDEVARWDDGDGGLRTEVLEVHNVLSNYAVTVKLFLHNRYDQQLHFHLDDVRIHYQGDAYSARPGQDWTADRDMVVRPKTYREWNWEFDLGTWAQPGQYEVTIEGMELVHGGDHTPIEHTFTFVVKVPGERSAAGGE